MDKNISSSKPCTIDKTPVLIVDDLLENRIALRKQLREFQDVEVFEASSGMQALELSANIEFALILLDVQMPQMDGYEVANILQSAGCKTPIIFVTAFGSNAEQQISGYDAGAVDYICKPVHPGVLMRKVKVFLELYERQEMLKLQHLYYRETLEQAFSGVIRTNKHDRIDFVNPSAVSLLCLDSGQLISQLVSDVFPEATQFNQIKNKSQEITLTRTNELNQEFTIVVTRTEIYLSARYQGSVYLIQDISEHIRYQKELLSVTQSDGMTGLYNRDFFHLFLAKSVHRAMRANHGLALLMIDLNDFKMVNDVLGHSAGDELIRHTASAIKHSIRDADLAARLGGDEFAVVIEDTLDKVAHASMQVARKISESIGSEVTLSGKHTKISAAIGVALYPEHASSTKQMFEAADMAMYRCKKLAIQVEFYNRELRQQLNRQNYILQHLKSDDLSDVLTVAYQPIVYFNQKAHWGMEALARWRKTETTPGPQQFVSVAEQNGQILSLTEYIAETVSHDVQTLSQQCKGLSYVSLNISPLLFKQPLSLQALLKNIHTLWNDKQKNCALCLEITESSPLDLGESLDWFWRFVTKYGWHLAIDDFGAGHSSINYFESVPCKTVKIDRCLTDRISRDSKRFRIVESVTQLAHDLGLSVVAEGVEDEDTLATVRAAGCDGVQGYYFAKPMPLEKVLNYDIPVQVW